MSNIQMLLLLICSGNSLVAMEPKAPGQLQAIGYKVAGGAAALAAGASQYCAVKMTLRGMEMYPQDYVGGSGIPSNRWAYASMVCCILCVTSCVASIELCQKSCQKPGKAD